MIDFLEKRRAVIIQFVRFCVVGASGMVVDMGITALLTEALHLDPRLSAFFGFCVAVLSNYFLNRLWTFKGHSGTSHAFSLASFLVICSVGMGISIGVMHLSMVYLGLARGQLYLVARLLGIIAATLWNFIGSKYVAFRA